MRGHASAKFIRMLYAPGDGPRAGSRRVRNAPGNIGREPGTSLEEEDVAEPPPAQCRVFEAVHASAKFTSPSNGQIVDGCRNPAVAACAINISEIGSTTKAIRRTAASDL